MSSFDYFVVSLNDGLYVNPMRESLGKLFGFCARHERLDGQEIFDMFVESGLAREFERQNPAFMLEKSGAELAEWMTEHAADTTRCSRATTDDAPKRIATEDGEGACGKAEPTTADDVPLLSWLGEMLAYFQATSGYTYRLIFDALPYKRLKELAIVYMPKETPESFAEILAERIEEMPRRSHLKTLRNAAHLSQAELARRSGNSLRAIQQYEQGAKNINRASAAALYRISLVLNCTIEDLLEPPVY